MDLPATEEHANAQQNARNDSQGSDGIAFKVGRMPRCSVRGSESATGKKLAPGLGLRVAEGRECLDPSLHCFCLIEDLSVAQIDGHVDNPLCVGVLGEPGVAENRTLPRG